MAGKSPKPSEEEQASDDRRAKARQGVLRDVLARSKGSTSMTRTGALEQINKERIDAGMPPMEFSNEEIVTEVEKGRELRRSNARGENVLADTLLLMQKNKDIRVAGDSQMKPTPTPGLTMDLDAARDRGRAQGRSALRLRNM
jgi:hypothetical protein